MRVLNVMLSEGIGGLELASLNYTLALQGLGEEVFYCIHPNAKVSSRIKSDTRVVTLANVWQHDIRAWFRVRRIVRAVAPDVIVVHGRRAMGLFSMAKRLFRFTTPIVMVMHGPRFNHIHHADQLIVVSQHLRDQVIERGVDARHVDYIPNFLLSRPGEAAPSHFRAPPVIGAFGRLSPVKGIDLFIEALAILKQAGIGFKAIIAGDGEQEAALNALAKTRGLGDAIEWLGWVESPTYFYEQIDLFCLPSRQESFGISLLEAMAHSKPVISTRTSGPGEQIADGENGLLCDITPAAIAASLQSAIEKPAMAAALAANAYCSSGNFMLEAIAPRIHDSLRKACAASALAEQSA